MMEVAIFYAVWCEPCDRMIEMMQEVAPEYKMKVSIVDIENPLNKLLISQCTVRTIPTLVILEGDAILDRVEGEFTKQQAHNWLGDVSGVTLAGERKDNEEFDSSREHQQDN